MMNSKLRILFFGVISIAGSTFEEPSGEKTMEKAPEKITDKGRPVSQPEPSTPTPILTAGVIR